MAIDPSVAVWSMITILGLSTLAPNDSDRTRVIPAWNIYILVKSVGTG